MQHKLKINFHVKVATVRHSGIILKSIHTLTHLHVSILSLYDAVVLVAVAELREATFVGL